MALALKDRVKETCAAPGTGTITLLGPAAGYAAFSTVGTGNTTYYAIVDPVTYQWEVGTGTWTTGGSYGTLSRTTVYSNSLGTTALINFSSGTQDVFITLPSQFAVTNVSVATANGFSGTTAVTASVPSLTLKTTANGILYGNSTSGVIAATSIGNGLTYTTGSLNVTTATRDTLGIVYGATGTNVTNVNNTGLGYNHIINTSVVNSTIIGSNANVSQIETSSYTTRGGVSVGYLSKATSTNSVAIGASAVGGGADSVVIGANATIGSATSYTLPQSIVIGSQSKITNSSYIFGNPGNILIGVNGSIANAKNVIAMGTNISIDGTSANNDGVVAIGENIIVPDNTAGTVVIGSGAYLDSATTGSALSAVVILGTGVGDGAVALGGGTNASTGATAVGQSAVAGNNSLALGSNANATTPNSIVLTAQGYPGLTAPNSGVFIDTIRDESAGSPDKTLKYNSTTKEIFYGTGGGGGSGTVTNVSVVTANGLGGTVATSTTTPAITLSSSVNGIVRGNGTALSAATIGSGLDYTAPTLSTVAATATVRGGLLYGATGNGTSSVNNTLYGFSGVLGASVTNATIIGAGANVSGTTSTYGSVAVGARAKSLVGDSVSVGADAQASYLGSIVVGANATASANYSVAIGADARTETAASGSVSIGWNSYTVNGTSVAIGQGTGADYDSSVVIGANAHDSAANAVVVGYGSVAGNGSITIGANTNNSQPNSIALSTSGTLSPANSGVFIDSMRDESAGSPNKTLKYNTTTKEIFYGTGGGGSGSVTDVSVVTANGFGGTVATSTTTPAITITTGVTGVLKGNGTAISAAAAGTDYAPATTGTSILYGNGTGGFSSVTVGSGLSFSAGTLSATGGAGTVTSIDVSGGTTGLTTSGGPVTTTGTITLGGTLGTANGGTGLTALGTGVTTFLGTPSSANLAAAVTDETGSGSLVFATSPTLVTPILGTPTSGTLSNCTVDGTDAVGFRNIPINSQSAAYTLVLADSGKAILHPSTDANARTFTIPANASVPYPLGTALTFINMTSQVVSIAITTDTMYLAGTGTTGTRSLAQYGMATAIKLTSTTWIISGNGMT